MTNKWFGQSWGAEACTQEDHVETPIGKSCDWCDEPIAVEDRGMIIASGQIYHLECFMRQVFGSAGHQLGQCGCNSNSIKGGCTFTDPPFTSMREAAKTAFSLWKKLESLKAMTAETDLRCYILDENEQPVATDPVTSSAFTHNEESRVVAVDKVFDVEISTVFLGVKHGGPKPDGLYLWETAIFQGEEQLRIHGRYESAEDARKGHKEAVAEVTLRFAERN